MIELMVALALTSLVLAGVLAFFVDYQRVTRQQSQLVELQGNLRAAADRMTSNLRRADYGAPRTLVSLWIDWVSGFTANPMVTQGLTASDPDTISIAACTAKPIATVAATLGQGAGNNTVTLTSAVSGQTVAQLLAIADNRDLIRFVAGARPDSGFARVTAVSGSTVTIDTDLGASGNQGFATRAYFPGTPVCRVDVTTYTVDPVSRTLTMNEHQGAAAQPAFDRIANLQVAGGGNTYNFVLSGETEQPDPTTGSRIPRQLAAQITIRNQ